VNVDLEQLEQLVDLLLHKAAELAAGAARTWRSRPADERRVQISSLAPRRPRPYRFDVRQVVAAGVDEERVGVAVDDLEVALLLGDGDGLLENVAAEARDHHGERLGVEARVRKAEAAVHAVGGELERLLPNVQLAPRRRPSQARRGQIAVSAPT